MHKNKSTRKCKKTCNQKKQMNKKCHEKSLKYKKVAMPQKPQRKTRFQKKGGNMQPKMRIVNPHVQNLKRCKN